jgi:hypothetical protein
MAGLEPAIHPEAEPWMAGSRFGLTASLPGHDKS